VVAIEKSETERIQIERKEYKGKAYVDIRLFFQNEEKTWCPTKKGVTVGPRKLGKLIAALTEIQKTLNTEDGPDA